MSSSSLSNLLFLSGFAALAMPGCDDPDDDGETAASTATDGAGSTGGSTDPSGTSDPSATTGEPTATTAGGDVGCPAFVAKLVECDPEYDYKTELGYCSELLEYLDGIGSDCRSAYDEVFACAISLDCAEFNSDESPTCQPALDAVEEICDLNGGSSGGGSTGGGSTGGGSTGGDSTGG